MCACEYMTAGAVLTHARTSLAWGTQVQVSLALAGGTQLPVDGHAHLASSPSSSYSGTPVRSEGLENEAPAVSCWIMVSAEPTASAAGIRRAGDGSTRRTLEDDNRGETGCHAWVTLLDAPLDA